MKLSPLYVLFGSPPPTRSGLKAICSSPIVRGFCKMTLLHWAGQRKSKVESSKEGEQSWPSRPQPSFAIQYVAVQPIKDSAGVRKDCAREKNASAMMYAAPSNTINQGAVSFRVALINHSSIGKSSPRRWMFKSGVGSLYVKLALSNPVAKSSYTLGRLTFGSGPLAYRAKRRKRE